MSILLDRRDDNTIRLYIDGDLQFDSRDERIYHEALALPALALAERRQTGPLRALICGGGDGLIARELLKSPRITHIDLVDYDQTIIDLARSDLAALNERSLDHLCTHTHVEDVWAFADRAAQRGTTYHLIVADLTVPQDIAGARLHSIDWYQRLRPLLSAGGIIAANATSPSGVPEGYWCIYNSMRAADLHPRPYRVALPSFAAMGYGADWGFLLAAAAPIVADELDDALPLAAPRHALQTPAQLRRLFVFPADLAKLRAAALPARDGSGILLHYLYNGSARQPDSQATWCSLDDERDGAALPEPDVGGRLLPPELQIALASPVGSSLDEEALLHRVLQLMPALQRHQTRAMIAAFLEDPGRFLGAINLPGLVEQLLRRAAELPRQLVDELRLLRAKLREFLGDHAGLLRLGMRIVTIVALVVIVANLLYPDASYGKGGDGGTAGSAGAAYTGDTVHLSLPDHAYDATVPPSVATNGGFRATNIGQGAAVDETGTLFPTRRYHYYAHFYGHSGYSSYHAGSQPAGAPTEDQSAYRLTPEADILNDGKIVVALNSAAYMLIDSELMTVIDQQTGEPLLFLERDPALVWRAAKEIERQQLGLSQTISAKEAWRTWAGWLSFTPGGGDDQLELANLHAMSQRLDAAHQSLGTIPAAAPDLPSPPVAGAFALFTGAWLLPDGSGLALQMPSGLAFMSATGLYRDPQHTQPLDERYPQGFKTLIVSYLKQAITDHNATMARMTSELAADNAELISLASDKSEYDVISISSSPSDTVEYGTSEIPLSEALQLTNADIARMQQRIALLQAQIINLPFEMIAAQQLITLFQ